jgi:hypothetical protein
VKRKGLKMKNKDLFISDFEENDMDCGAVTHMVIFVRLPNGVLEMIINTSDIYNKFKYYCNAYDDNLCLKNNPDVKIEKWCFASQ